MRRALVLLAMVLSACAPTRARAPRPKSSLPTFNAPPPQRMRVHAIDVGQGSATLLEFPCAAVLIDTGGEDSNHFNSTRALLDYLEAFFARRMDLNRTLSTVFITHPHLDHTRGLPEVMRRFSVAHLVTNGLPRGVDGSVFESGGEQQDAAEKQAFAHGGLRKVFRDEIPPESSGLSDGHIDSVRCEEVDPAISVLWGGLKGNSEGWEVKTYANMNNHSLVIRVEVDHHVTLLTGDLETEAIHSLVAAFGSQLDADVLFVGHHGSHNGTTMSLVQRATPCMAVVSMGDSAREEDWTAWAYGHPRKKAIDLVAKGLVCSRPPKDVKVATKMRTFEQETLSTALYGTGWEGTVVLEQSERGTWKAATER